MGSTPFAGPKVLIMAHIRKDTLTKTLQWWKHLRPEWKRRTNKRERIAAKADIAKRLEK